VPDRYPTQADLDLHSRRSPQRRSMVRKESRNACPAQDREAL